MFALLLSLLLLLNPEAKSDSVISKSEISGVTVFKNQAQINRKAEVDLKSGITTIVFTGLAETLIDQSIQIKGSGSFVLLSLTTKFDFQEKPISNENVSALRSELKSLEEKLKVKQADLEVLHGEIDLLGSTQNIVKNNKMSIQELEALISLYRTKLSELLSKKISVNNEISELNNSITLVRNKISESGSVERTRFKEIIAEVQTSSDQALNFDLSYLVFNAGWTPVYDIRSDDVNNPLSLTYKAKITQNTGVNWNNVKFTINSGDPSSNSTKPELNTNYVGYFSPYSNSGRTNARIILNKIYEPGVIQGRIYDYSTGDPVPSATVQIIELQKGVASDENGTFTLKSVPNGNYSLRVSFVGYDVRTIPITIFEGGLDLVIPLEQDLVGLEALVVTAEGSRNQLTGKISGVQVRGGRYQARGYAIQDSSDEPEIIQNQVVSNQTSFSYEINVPYSVPSDGKEHTLEIKRESTKTEYAFGAVPKISKYAYLVASLPDWNNLNLISGEANIYFDNSFVGTTKLNPVSIDDTLMVSLGKDERIVIEREKLNEFSSKNFFRNKVREMYSYEIRVRNTKSETINLMLEDQIPVSTNEDIKVSHKQLTDGQLNEETGMIKWALQLEPGASRTIRLDFEIEYPRGRVINF